MKKRALIRAMLLLLSLLLLTSCQNTVSNEGHTTEGETTATTSNPNISENELLLVSDRQAYCGIVRAKDASADIKSLCSKLSDTIVSKTKSTMQLIADTRQLSDGMIEILIGDTNRPESAEAKKMLGKQEYSVSVVNGKVVVVGSDDVMLEKAIAHLINMIESPSEQLERGTWTISKTYNEQFDGSDYKYNDYIGKGFELTAEHTLLKKMSPSGGTTTAGERIPWVQGGCTDGTYYYYCMITDDSVTPTKCVILKYDIAKQSMVKNSAELQMGHANDAAYNPHNNTIVVSAGGTSYYVIDPDTLKVKKTVQMESCWAISYDVERRLYILANNSSIYFYDDNYQFQNKFSIAGDMLSEYPTNGNMGTQGITSDSKYIYYLEYWQNKSVKTDIRCNIVVFDINNGNLVDRIPLKMGREVENIIIWNNSFYIVCNNITWTGAECYQIKLVPKI